ncbi:MAG: Tma20 N-terminal domain-containing protein [Candidatus Hodarchaeales archaeon]|jgi:predicted ribosome-associated RNA-binding protein Tma20
MKIKQRHFIRKSELKTLKEEILKQYDHKFVDQIFPVKSNVELIQIRRYFICS